LEFKEKLATIFDNFQQAAAGTSRIYGGTGLGLAIVKQLVEPQGGIINVVSKVGKGTTFSFRLNFEKQLPKQN
jgi:signal transduction histidine kinase